MRGVGGFSRRILAWRFLTMLRLVLTWRGLPDRLAGFRSCILTRLLLKRLRAGLFGSRQGLVRAGSMVASPSIAPVSITISTLASALTAAIAPATAAAVFVLCAGRCGGGA